MNESNSGPLHKTKYQISVSLIPDNPLFGIAALVLAFGAACFLMMFGVALCK